MTTFKQAVAKANQVGLTEKGAKTYTTTLNACVDLFFMAGARRGSSIENEFISALSEDEDVAIRILLWLRDIRGGAGERKLFRDTIQLIEELDTDLAIRIANKIPELGRWDDLLVFESLTLKRHVNAMIGKALVEENGLCAKWMPRKGPVAVRLRKALGLTPKEYRKTLVRLTRVVESQMCAKKWDEIDFEKVPSLASARYQKAFMRHCGERYEEYQEKLKSGDAKVNTGAVYPYDVIISHMRGNKTVSNKMWEDLPNYLTKDNHILPIVDMSGSMYVTIPSTKILAALVSQSIGLYLATKQTGAFAGMVMNFSSESQIIEIKSKKLTGALKEIEQLRYIWGGSTNIQAAFSEILNLAVRKKIPQKEMPKYLLILSDMEFDRCANWNKTAFKNLKDQYKQAGYELPKIVFWNIMSRNKNVPVKHDTEKNVALVSGFSPSIMKSILACKNFNPKQIMLDTVMHERYNY